MKTKKYLVPLFLVVIIILAVIITVLLQKPSEVEFTTGFIASPEFDCFGGIRGAGCYVNLTFPYEGKDYIIDAVHYYAKEPQEDLGLSARYSGIKLIDNQMKIKGLYNSAGNILYNYSIIE